MLHLCHSLANRLASISTNEKDKLIDVLFSFVVGEFFITLTILRANFAALQTLDTPEQKHEMQPSGFSRTRAKYPVLQRSQKSPSTCLLQIQSPSQSCDCKVPRESQGHGTQAGN